MKVMDHRFIGKAQVIELCYSATALITPTYQILVINLNNHSVYPSVCRTDGYGTDRRLQEHALFRAKNVFLFF